MDYGFPEAQKVYTAPPQDDSIGFDNAYIKTRYAMLKIIEMVLDFIIFLCALFEYWGYLGGSWVQFVAISALITTLFFFILHAFKLIRRLPFINVLMEFVYYCIYTVVYVISAIICITRAIQYSLGSIIAAAIFCWAAVIVYGIDTFFQYLKWKGTRPQHVQMGTTSTTVVTTTTHFETTPTQY